MGLGFFFVYLLLNILFSNYFVSQQFLSNKQVIFQVFLLLGFGGFRRSLKTSFLMLLAICGVVHGPSVASY